MTNFDVIILARAIHIISVVIWIGGVAMVTLALLPSIRKENDQSQALVTFEKLEARFSTIAKVTTVLAAVSGFTLLHLLNGWARFQQTKHWWLYAMIIIWLLFSLILFVIEPFFLHKLKKRFSNYSASEISLLIQRVHAILLLLSLLTIAAAVAGSHGW